MNTGILITLIVIGGVVCGEVLSCDSCGAECVPSCGKRQFRACCYNYLRKRSGSEEMDPSLRLELFLARSRGEHGPLVVPPYSNGLFTSRHHGNNDLPEFESRKDTAEMVMNESM